MYVGGRGATTKSAQRWQLDRIWESFDLGFFEGAAPQETVVSHRTCRLDGRNNK